MANLEERHHYSDNYRDTANKRIKEIFNALRALLNESKEQNSLQRSMLVETRRQNEIQTAILNNQVLQTTLFKEQVIALTELNKTWRDIFEYNMGYANFKKAQDEEEL